MKGYAELSRQLALAFNWTPYSTTLDRANSWVVRHVGELETLEDLPVWILNILDLATADRRDRLRRAAVPGGITRW